MFEQRLKVSLAVLAGVTLVFVARLVQLQVVRGAEYRRQVAELTRSAPKPVPFVRGRILERLGSVLASDEPCWEIRVDYSVLALDEEHVARWVRYCKRKGRYPEASTDAQVETALRRELLHMWEELAAFERMLGEESGEAGAPSVAELQTRAAEIVARVRRVREAVSRRRGFDAEVAEERAAHPIVTRLGAAQQIAAREAFAVYPWVKVEDASYRQLHGWAKPYAHILGRLGRVDAEDVTDDPCADDPFARYDAQELIGRTGVEGAAERRLRGRRGQLTTDREGNICPDVPLIPAQDGQDVTLTLRRDLQEELYLLLERAVARNTWPAGGTIVVLEVPTREVLALVSYPSFDPTQFRQRYTEWRDATETLPLLFRAVGTCYPPGSIIKPLVCLAGLQRGVITLESREECTGYLFPDVHDKWRCWQIAGTDQRKAHGSVNLVEALTGSCNVFMYRLGERLGVDALCDAFDMVGVGKLSGIGLQREEFRGINPTPAYLVQVKGTPVNRAHSRLFAIGQGEISMTPVQVANLVAAYANGKLRPVTLMRTEEPTPEWTLPGQAAHWQAIRQGMFNVVNHPEGTAYRYARFEHESYALCGKTGSATAYARPTSYRIPYVDPEGREQVAFVRAGGKKAALDLLKQEYPEALYDPAEATVATTWPPEVDPTAKQRTHHAHAWFAGYLQAVDAEGQPRWSVTPRIAFVVLIEFGESGGRAAGPAAREVAAKILELLGPELDADAPEQLGGQP